MVTQFFNIFQIHILIFKLFYLSFILYYFINDTCWILHNYFHPSKVLQCIQCICHSNGILRFMFIKAETIDNTLYLERQYNPFLLAQGNNYTFPSKCFTLCKLVTKVTRAEDLSCIYRDKEVKGQGARQF